MLELVKQTNNSEHFLCAQSCIFSSLFVQIHKAINDFNPFHEKIFIQERSLSSALRIFATDGLRTGACSQTSFLSLYYQYKNYESLISQYYEPLYIFLDTPTKECSDRLSQRNFSFDKDSYEFLDRINKLHHEFFNSHLMSLKLDGGKKPEENATILLKHINNLFPQIQITSIDLANNKMSL